MPPIASPPIATLRNSVIAVFATIPARLPSDPLEVCESAVIACAPTGHAIANSRIELRDRLADFPPRLRAERALDALHDVEPAEVGFELLVRGMQAHLAEADHHADHHHAEEHRGEDPGRLPEGVGGELHRRRPGSGARSRAPCRGSPRSSRSRRATRSLAAGSPRRAFRPTPRGRPTSRPGPSRAPP